MTYLLAFAFGFTATLSLTRRFPGLVDWWGRVEDKVTERLRLV